MRYLVYHKHGIIRKPLSNMYIYSPHIRYSYVLCLLYRFINQ